MAVRNYRKKYNNAVEALEKAIIDDSHWGNQNERIRAERILDTIKEYSGAMDEGDVLAALDDARLSLGDSYYREMAEYRCRNDHLDAIKKNTTNAILNFKLEEPIYSPSLRTQ